MSFLDETIGEFRVRAIFWILTIMFPLQAITALAVHGQTNTGTVLTLLTGRKNPSGKHFK